MVFSALSSSFSTLSTINHGAIKLVDRDKTNFWEEEEEKKSSIVVVILNFSERFEPDKSSNSVSLNKYTKSPENGHQKLVQMSPNVGDTCEQNGVLETEEKI